MREEDFGFGTGAWVGNTTLHPVALISLCVLGTAMILLPRRWAIFPITIMSCFMAPAQRIVVLGLDFNLIRIMVLIGWLRIFVRQEFRAMRWKPLDWAICLWSLASIAAYTTLCGTMS